MLSSFDYQRVGAVEEAVLLLRKNSEAKLLAGGQSLLAAMRLGLSAPEQLIDLQSISALSTIEIKGDELYIGAMATHAKIAASNIVRQFSPMLARLAHGIADEQIRQRGTLGGAIANNDPAACWPCGLMSHQAVVVTDRREIPCDDFFLGMFATALEIDEVICTIKFKKPVVAEYVKFEQPASRFAIVGVSVAQFLQNNDVRVAITGLGLGVIRYTAAEQLLAKSFSAHSLQSLCPIAIDDAIGDLHASAQYRAHLATVLTKRAIAAITSAA